MSDIDRIRPFPFLADRHRLKGRALRADLIAGLVVAVFAIPQVMAYAELAGLSPVYGLYSATVMGFVAALFGSSPWINTGPTNSAALLTLAALSPFVAAGANPLPLVFAFTLLVGAIRIGMGLLKLGGLTHFVPESAFLGFTVGAGTLIAMGQLHNLLGLQASRESTFLGRTAEVLSHADSTNLAALGIGAGTFLVMLSLDRYARKVPVALFAIAGATLAAYFIGFDNVRIVADQSPVPSGLPAPRAYGVDLSVVVELFPAALAVAVIGLVEAVSIGGVLAMKHDRPLSYNQEFFGQGLSHIVGAFFQGFPGSGSFSRSALIEGAGGETRFANVFYSVALALTTLLMAPLLNYIPYAALAGLLFFIAVKLIDVERIRRVFRMSRADAGIMVLTFVVTVGIKIEWGFFAGLIAALALHLRQEHRLVMTELVPIPDIGFEERAYAPERKHQRSDLVAVSVNTQLFYALAPALREQLEEIVTHQSPRAIVMRLRGQGTLDSTCWSAIFDFSRRFKEKGGRLFISGVSADFRAALRAAKMKDVLPDEQIVEAEDVQFLAMHQALERARAALGADAVLSKEWRAYFESRAQPGVSGNAGRFAQAAPPAGAAG